MIKTIKAQMALPKNRTLIYVLYNLNEEKHIFIRSGNCTWEFTESSPNLFKMGLNDFLFILDGSCVWHHSDACRHSKVRLENNETDSFQLNRPGNIQGHEYLFQQ